VKHISAARTRAVATRSGFVVPGIVCRRPDRALLPRILRSHHPQQEYAHGAYYRAADLFFGWCDRHNQKFAHAFSLSH
jgi:hypothetical protein